VKTFKHLYPQIHAFENLETAFRKARRGKRHKPSVASFEINLGEELLALQEELETETYQPGPYTHFHLYDGKPRRISAAPFRDRVVHHALCNLIEPIWEARFIHDSYACRKGKGAHAAVERYQGWARRYTYALKMDVEKYFPSIDRDILKEKLRQRVKDRNVLSLLDRIIDTGPLTRGAAPFFPGDDLFALDRPTGIPIGNLTSQLFSNVYLGELDRFVKQELRWKPYLRYMDDILLFG